ncbi:MAG: type 4a pilus biogenesis protein PilO [Acidimicrobiales bacterium]|jgi:Tfp pilus assembly protein PilO
MSGLRAINLDLLKSKVVLIITGSVILLLIIWWFAWMTPESNKLATVNSQIAADQTTVSQLNAELTSLKAERKLVLKELPFLKKVTTAIPPTEDPPGIVDSLNTLANQTGCNLSSVTPADSPTPSGTPGLSNISVTFALSGTHSDVFSFLNRFYKMKRLMTIDSVSLAPTSTAANILAAGDGQPYSMALTATAYTTYVAPTGTT